MTTENIVSKLDKEAFWGAAPFPHLVLDNFLAIELAENAEKEFPSKKELKWTPYLHFNEMKYGLSNKNLFPEPIKQIIDLLHSESFCMHLAEMIGCKKLFPDPELVGGGLHQTFRGGFLNIHTDFSHHPHIKNLKRRINLLLFLNKNWPADYEGNLELWNIKTKKKEQDIAPILNRAVIFLTDENALHGSPKRIKCEENESRKSIALYYYEEETNPNNIINATRYYNTDGKIWKKIIIEIENLLLKVFTKIRFCLKFRH